ncbi:MAG: nuclear transport factor 2 family protein [Dehalococcoidales bacterium]|nr:nuclear transport factor 2 family protein [Dehalococcoidales bacterium]
MTLEEIEKRLEAIEDIEAIKKLQRKYVYALASQQWDDMLECFDENGSADIWNHGLKKGQKEIAELFSSFSGKILPTHGHLVAQPVIDVDGHKAQGYWLLYLFLPDADSTWVQGRYDCEYVKVKGEWKFKHLKYTRPWPDPETITRKSE